MAGDIYKNHPRENLEYCDGSRAKELGAAITTNPFTSLSEDWFSWNDGWNKVGQDKDSLVSKWNFLTAITSTDPGLGNLKLNAVTFATSTIIYASFTNAEGSTVLPAMNGIKAGDVIKFYNASDATNFVIFTVVNVTILVFATITVTYGSSAGSLFSNNGPILMQLTRA